jgi:RHS repeat-associated protein
MLSTVQHRSLGQQLSFDALDRPVTATTGAQQVVDPQGQSFVTTSYSRRGVVDSVTSGYGSLVTSIVRAADGPVSGITYGDLAGTATAFTYDARRRVQNVLTTRGPPASWPTSASSEAYVYQHTLEDSTFQYDLVDNPVTIQDLRTPSEWPAGAQPVKRTVTYDDLYRAIAMGYSTGPTPDVWVDPFQAEDTGESTDPRQAMPSPHVLFTNRVQSQTVAYDWLGNTVQSGDDVGGFYDRSLGTITNGGTGAGPYQLTGASGGTSPREGSLETLYDAAGNLVGMTVARPDAPCVPADASCTQRYVYYWDEVGRLVQALRWDGEDLGTVNSVLPDVQPTVNLSYAYDASADRIIKTAVDGDGNAVNTVYIFSALELRRAAWTGNDYDDQAATEVPYLFAHGARLARVDYATVDPKLNASGTTHLILELVDHLGSTTIAIDQATSELVERGTFLGYGGADSDYRPTGWGSFREDYRFTGKEDDVEVGLDHFGKRFYAPLLGRWVSADPLAVHSPGRGDLNVYAYVHGRVFVAVDILGLDTVMVIWAMSTDRNAPAKTANRMNDEHGFERGVEEYAAEWAKAADHHVVSLTSGMTNEQILAAFQEAGRQAHGGEVIVTGHGAAAGEGKSKDSAVTIAPGRLVTGNDVDQATPAYASAHPTLRPGADTNADVLLLGDIGQRLQEMGTTSVRWYQCWAGRDARLIQNLADRMGIHTEAYTSMVTAGVDANHHPIAYESELTPVWNKKDKQYEDVPVQVGPTFTNSLPVAETTANPTQAAAGNTPTGTGTRVPQATPSNP